MAWIAHGRPRVSDTDEYCVVCDKTISFGEQHSVVSQFGVSGNYYAHGACASANATA